MVAQFTPNPGGAIVGLGVSGFGFHYTRDYGSGGTTDRWRYMEQVLRHLNDDPDPPIGGGDTPRRTTLAQNYPNPFNPTTTIEYTLKEQAHVSLKVYNVAGQLVRTLVDEVREANTFVESWNGMDQNGRPVPAGMYFYHVDAPGWSASKKMTVAY